MLGVCVGWWDWLLQIYDLETLYKWLYRCIHILDIFKQRIIRNEISINIAINKQIDKFET